ncbi:hypothetical protein [Nonomuraea pusilla]|uniref:Spore-associated protein A n=1 Tax=Nonomuraea pusilla TaxID=46177 RepID=A0A1H7X2Q0_9ACTN|nr:hypothetical protein [Nonomuraea pusilla]SEM28146.1 hypothetical protein SAMN05660976_04731 [Nonomuraea pusilla]
MKVRTAFLASVAALATAAGLVTAAAPANAAGPCGAGYRLLDRVRPVTSAGGATGGYLYVYWNGSTGKSCAVVRPIDAWAGKVVDIAVAISTSTASDSDVSESGKGYRYYAGRAYVSARNTCINVYGGVLYGDVVYTGSYRNIHCD